MGQIRKNFDVREFVPRHIWQQYGQKSRWFLDPRMLDLAQFYRDYFGAPVHVNTWATGWLDSAWELRGFRPPRTDTGAEYSQHKFGRAFDCNVKGIRPDEVRRHILEDQETFMEAGLTTLEDGSIADTWIHSDVRTTSSTDILIVTP